MRARESVALLLAIACAAPSHADLEREPDRRVVLRPLAPSILPKAAPSGAPGAPLGEPGLEPVLVLDGRSEWRYFLAQNELARGPITPLAPGDESLDDRRRASRLSALHLPPFTGAAYWLPGLPEDRWSFELEASFGADSTLAALVAFCSRPHPPVPDRIEPGSIRARLQGEQVAHAVFPIPSTGSVATLSVTAPEGAVSALLLISNHGPRIERVESVRVYAPTPYGDLLRANVFDERGCAILPVGASEARALVVPPGASRATSELAVPRGGLLSGRVGALARSRPALVEFALDVEVAGGGRERFPIGASGRIGEFRCDFARYAGRRVKLHFASGRDALVLCDLILAGDSPPLPPVVVLVLDGMTLDSWASRRPTPLLDSLLARDSEAGADPIVSLERICRDRIEPGRRCVAYGPELRDGILGFADRFVRGDFLAPVPITVDPDLDPFSDALSTLVSRDGVPAVLVLATASLAAAHDERDEAKIVAAYTALERRVSDLLRRAGDLGIADSVEWIVLLGEGDRRPRARR